MKTNAVVVLVLLVFGAALAPAHAETPKLSKKQKQAERHLYMARYYIIQESDRKAAIRELEKAVALDPGHLNANLALASMYSEDKQPKKAIPLLKKLVQKHPDNVSVLLALGDAELASNNHAAALKTYQQAVTRAPAEVEAAYRVFAVHWLLAEENRGDKEALLKAAQALIAVAEPSSSYYRTAARTVVSLSGDPLAVVVFDAGTAYELAFSAYEPNTIAKYMATAREGYESCLEKQPAFERCHYGLGLVYSSVKAGKSYDPAKARQHFGKAAGMPEAYFQLSRMARLDNDVKAAEAAVKRGLELEPDNQELQVELGVVQKLTGKDSDALATLVKAYDLDPASAAAERAVNEVAAIQPDHELVVRVAYTVGQLGGDVFSTDRFKAAVSTFESNYGGVDTGAAEQKVLEQVLARILEAADADSQVPLVPYVLKSEEVNAIALPNGNIYFTRGFFDAMKKSFPDRKIDQNHAVIGHIMGHEVAHVLRQHTLHSSLYQQAVRDASAGLDGSILTHVTRLQETEADRLGMVWASLAGYHPRGGIEFMESQGKEMEIPRGLDHPTYDERVQYLEEYWSNDVKYAHVSFQLGLSAVAAGDRLVSSAPDKARAEYESAVDHFRRYRNTLLPTKRVLNNLGAAYARLGMLELAKKESPLHSWQTPFSLEKESALRYTPVTSGGTRGGDSQMPGDLKRAIGLFKEALKRDPRYSKAKANLASAYLLTGDLDKARQALEGVSGAALEQGELALVRGVYLAEQKKYDEAEKAFKAAEVIPDTARAATYNLARLYGLRGDKARAKTAYAAYTKRYPGDAWAAAAKKAMTVN